ncbi:MAG TPA: ATP-binding protein [Saprospiraceae bacterium]|nr:ATP-binding protein [Saprospiraceae bacterium]
MFHIWLMQPAMAQMKVRYAYSETFRMNEGLEHNVVSDIKTDQNDLLWVAVHGKLQLFDGDQFVDMNHLIHGANAIGSFGFENGKDVFFLKQHILYKFTPAQYTSRDAPSYTLSAYSIKDHRAKIIYEDGDYLYISHPNDSLYQIYKETLKLKQAYRFPHQPNHSYRWSSIYIDPQPVKAIHYFDTNSLKCTFDLITGKTSIDPNVPNAWRGALASGDTLLVLEKHTLEIYTGGKRLTMPLPEEARFYNGEHFLLCGRDSVYVSLNNSLCMFNLRTMTWTSKLQRIEGPSAYNIGLRSMVLDKTGHLYFTTFNTGLIKMYPSNDGFQYIGVQGKKKYFIKCIRVSEKNNLVLAGTFQDGLLVFDTTGILKHHIQHFPDTHPLKLVSTILKIEENRFVFLADKTIEVTFNGDGYSLRELKDSDRYRLTYYDNAVEDARHQRYFVFNHVELHEIRPDDPKPIVSIKHPAIASSISATMSGDMYVMSILDELRFYHQDLSYHSIKFNVPYFGYSRCIVPYTPGKFLVATDLGIFLLDTLHPGVSHSPIYDHLVYSILPGDHEGEFWFSTDYGLYRLDADLSYKRFSIESGLQESEFNTNSCYKSESGKLYFGGINGITAFYPSHIEKEEDTPLPYISTLSINGKVRERYIAPGARPTYTLRYDENVIQLRLLGKGLRSPRSYNFQYMVKGLHDAWINLGRNMDIQLQLPPGRYTIYYHIAGTFEPEATTLHALQVRINPPLSRRWWFITILSLVPLYVLYYIMNLRRKRQALKQAYAVELEQQLHEERLRISRELHDNIGAQMATVKRSINFMIEHSDRLTPEQSRNQMNALESISSQINQELRDTIWAVQNNHIDVAGFFTRLKNYVFQLVGPDSPLRVVYLSSGDLSTLLGPFTALNLHRICQESINNIIKHAAATEINITVDSLPAILKITITDNGKGYDLKAVQEGYGLGNIRKRAEQIGAIVLFKSSPGSGSSIEIEYKRVYMPTDKTPNHG